MGAQPQRPKERKNDISTLNAAIDTLNVAKDALDIAPAKAVFASVSAILAMIRDAMINRVDYFNLGMACVGVCTALERGLRGKKHNDLSDSVYEAIEQLRTAVATIQERVTKQGNQNAISRHFHAKSDKERIATWRSDLNKILHIFNTELAINTHVAVTSTHNMVSEIHRTVVKSQEGGSGRSPLTQTSISGEIPPLPSRTFFGRNELVEKIVDLAENLVPLALIGPGGIGKTSVALAVLHHDRIKQRFGDDRWFIRCDKLPASRAHFLHRLSNLIGAGIENPEDLTSLRAFLSSKDMLIVLDNAESILDPQVTDSQDIYAVVGELSRFNNICVCITSRISVIPSDYRHLNIPALSLDAARNTFYGIYDSNDRSKLVDGILEQLDFHPLSITLLATVGHQNKWNTDRLAREWERRRTSVLRTQHNGSLAAAIELSLTSPMFQDLGPDARAILEVVAFFPQGVDENNFHWLFAAIPNITNIFDGFSILSLAYRTNGFITMLAPLRDYFSPRDPRSSSLLCATKDRYFTRMSVDINPNNPDFGRTRWIRSEDVNVEHLLDVFTTADANSDDVWDACVNFMSHLYWCKPRLVILRPNIEGLPDDHHSKPRCLFWLSRLLGSVGNQVEREILLTHALRLWWERGSDRWVGRTLRELSDTNCMMGLYMEGIQRARNALEIYKRLGDAVGQARCLKDLAFLLSSDNQLGAAEEAASRAIDLLPEKGEEFRVCECHRALGHIYRFRGKTKKAIHHFEAVLEISSSFNWDSLLFWVHCDLAGIFLDEDRFDDAQDHLEQAESHAVGHTYYLGRVAELQARVWYKQRRIEAAVSEALRAAAVYENLGATSRLEQCREFLRDIQKEHGSNPRGTKWYHRLWN